MPPPRKISPRRRDRRTRSRSYSPRPSYSSRRRSGSRSPRDNRGNRRSRSPERARSPPRRRSFSPRERSRSPRQVARRSPPRRSPPRRSRSPSYERNQPVRVAADSSGKRVPSYRSRSPSPIQVKRSRDEREYRDEAWRSDTRREDGRRYPSPTGRSQERGGYSPRGRSPSPRQSSGRRQSPYTGKMYADKPSTSRAPLFPSGKKRDEISSVFIINKNRLERLDKRFQTLEQLSRGAFDFEENITIGIHRGPQHVSLDEDIPVNYSFNTKSFLMLYPKKETHKAIFDRDEILQFHHDDILDEEAYVEKRTITVQPTEKSKPRWSDSMDYKITIGKSSRDEEFSGSDRRMVRDSGRRRSSREPEVTVRLDPKPDPRYEKIFRDSQRRTQRSRSRSRSREPVIRDPHDLRHNLNKRQRDDYEKDNRDRMPDRGRGDRREERGMVDARRKIEARRSEQGASLDRGLDIRITKMEQKERRRSEERLRKEKGRASLDKELPDFKNRPEKFNFESWKEKPEITPKGSSYYLHDERARDDMNYWERKQFYLATGKSPTTRPPPTRGRGSFRGRGAPRPPRGRGSPRGYVPAFVMNRESTRELEWKHDKFSEIDKETGKDTKMETHKIEGKDKDKKKNVKDKDDSESKKKVKKDKGKHDKDSKSKNNKDSKSKDNKDRKSKDKKEEKNKDNKDRGSKDKKERESRESKKDKEKETKSKERKETHEKEKSKSNGAASVEDNDLDEGNVGPNFSNLLTLT